MNLTFENFWVDGNNIPDAALNLTYLAAGCQSERILVSGGSRVDTGTEINFSEFPLPQSNPP